MQCVEDIGADKGHIALYSYPHRKVYVCLCGCYLLPKQALKSTWVQQGKCMYRLSTGWRPIFPCACMKKNQLTSLHQFQKIYILYKYTSLYSSAGTAEKYPMCKYATIHRRIRKREMALKNPQQFGQ